ncbi:hypothetical protein QVD17_23118 [Tagetes erecta]|uniref:Disease resistance protein At4g27190-like leucine-rich repeats domain-containing protein n=1 Tax=Tagetes erecta TaxID=13708 RepID=A0AAD8NU31_TARER|nr:hypothetical protein QVD17_23118 [Tagetes erecta]
MMAFTAARSTTPRLKYIHTELGKHNLECGLNFYVTSTLLQKPSTSLDPLSSTLTIYEQKPWSFHNLIECNLDYNNNRQKIFPSNKLQHLQNLETIHARHCWDIEEVFEVAMEATNNESQNVVKLSKLREVELNYLLMLKSGFSSGEIDCSYSEDDE